MRDLHKTLEDAGDTKMLAYIKCYSWEDLLNLLLSFNTLQNLGEKIPKQNVWSWCSNFAYAELLLNGAGIDLYCEDATSSQAS